MSYKRRNSGAPLLKLGDGPDEVDVVEGTLLTIRPSTKFADNFLYDIQTATGQVTVAGCTAIGENLHPKDVGHAVRLKFDGWRTAKRSGSRYKSIVVEVDDETGPTAASPASERDVPLPDEPGDDNDALPY